MARCIDRRLDPFRYGHETLIVGCLLTFTAFFFLEETGFAREKESVPLPQRPRSFISNRIATFFPGTAVVHRPTVAQIVGLSAILYSYIFVDDVGYTLCNAIEDWSIASHHDSRFLRCLHLRFCCGLGDNSLNFPADAEKGRRLRLYAKAERRMWVALEDR